MLYAFLYKHFSHVISLPYYPTTIDSSIKLVIFHFYILAWVNTADGTHVSVGQYWKIFHSTGLTLLRS